MLSSDCPISDIPLSQREYKAMRLLGVSTVSDFLQLYPPEVLKLRNYGSLTYGRIERKHFWLKCLNSESEDDVFNDIRQYLDKGIWFFGLSIRGEETLRRLEIKTVRDFLSLDLSNVKHFSGCGRTTQQELIAVQRLFCGQSEVHAARTKLATEHSANHSQGPWKALPLFSDQPISGLCEFHPSCHPDSPIERLAFPKNISQALAKKRIDSLGKLLLTPGPELTEPKRIGERTLHRIRATVDECLTYLLEGPSRTEVNWATPDGFLLSLLQAIITDERQRRVLLERMGWRSKPRTLEVIGRKLGLTRERIRQIEKKGLKKLLHWKSVAILQPLHDLLCAMLKELGPVLSLKAICRQLQEQFSWNRPLHEKALAKLLPAFPDLKLVKGRYVTYVDGPLLPAETRLAHKSKVVCNEPRPRGSSKNCCGGRRRQPAGSR